MRFVSCVFLLAFATASPALAKGIDAQSTITAVTVYPDAARVTREVKLDLPAGAAAIIFRGLPRTLDPASLHVSGDHVSILSVETRPAEHAKSTSTNATKLKELQEAADALKVTIAALEAKQAMISHFGEASPASSASTAMAVKDWTAAFDAVGAAHAKTGEEMRLAKAKLTLVENEIGALQEADEAAELPNGAQDVVVSVDGVGGTAHLALEYKVTEAHWTPAYEARLDTGGNGHKPLLELTRRALIWQKTGEDWKDVPLTVTTLRIQHMAAAPEVRAQQLSLAETKPAPVASAAPAPVASPASDAQRRNEAAGVLWQSPMGPIRFDSAMPQVKASQAQADLDAAAYQASYKLAKTAMIDSDGSEKSFALTIKRFEPALSIHVSPSIDATGYLQARFRNEDAAPMLSGKMSVIRDGVYVGAATIAFVAPGEEADIGFGADDKVKVTQTSLARSEDEPGWLGNSRSKTRDVNTAVKNLHDFPVHVEIRDRVPAAENSQIAIETLLQTTRPSQPTIAGKPGVIEWAFDLAPQEAKEVRLAWRVKWPADRELVEPQEITSNFRFNGSTNF